VCLGHGATLVPEVSLSLSLRVPWLSHLLRLVGMLGVRERRVLGVRRQLGVLLGHAGVPWYHPLWVLRVVEGGGPGERPRPGKERGWCKALGARLGVVSELLPEAHRGRIAGERWVGPEGGWRGGGAWGRNRPEA
jgi:hypothetical protein